VHPPLLLLHAFHHAATLFRRLQHPQLCSLCCPAGLFSAVGYTLLYKASAVLSPKLCNGYRRFKQNDKVDWNTRCVASSTCCCNAVYDDELLLQFAASITQDVLVPWYADVSLLLELLLLGATVTQKGSCTASAMNALLPNPLPHCSIDLVSCKLCSALTCCSLPLDLLLAACLARCMQC
jgi:hypothetical protein